MKAAKNMLFTIISGQPVTAVVRYKILGSDYEEHVTSLEDNVSMIERYRDCLILDNKKISSWYVDLQDVMYAAIDALDVYAIAVEKKSMYTVKERLNEILSGIFKDEFYPERGRYMTLADTAQRLNKKIEELLEHGNTLGYQDWIEFKLKRYPGQQEPSWLPYEDLPVIGRDADKDDIIRWLKADESEVPLQILPVVGMGGIGKTALVRSLFSSEKDSFDLYGWVQCPFEGIDAVPLLTNIWSQFERDAPRQTFGLENLTDLVRRNKFLLVIDDVWCEDRDWWLEVLGPLKHGKPGCKLIITTRLMEVVKTIGICHKEGVLEPEVKLEGLEKGHLWQILKNNVFGVHEPVLGYAERTGKWIVGKLQGLPLAAVAMARLLRSDWWSENHWERMADSNVWDVLKSRENVNPVPALSRSFLHLPAEAKPCFRYCSMFAPSHWSEIPTVREVVYQWLAHGYLQVQDEESVEDTGDTMLSLLESTSLLATQRHLDMHDLLYDVSQARDDHLQLSDDRNMDQLPVESLRHLYINTPASKFNKESVEKLGNCKKLRTLIFKIPEHDRARGLGRALGVLFPQLNSLRVLTLACLSIRELPEEIGELKHLRYLDLSGNFIKCLPATMAELRHLQVLILNRTGYGEPSWRQLPEEMDVLGKLSKLRYLQLSRYGFETLPEIVTSLSDLRVLSLSFCSKLKELPDGISNLKRLECLEMRNSGIRKLPEGLSSLSCLRVLSITGCQELTTLPCNLTGLGSLSRLDLPNDLLHSISGVGKLTSLQNLEEFPVQQKEGHKIEELANLNMLCHELTIGNLELVKSKAEAQRSKLEQKLKLEKLELHWHWHWDRTRDVIIEEAVIEGLKPSRDLKGLAINYYMGKKLPSWLTSQHLRFLKSLWLSDLLNIGEIGGLGYAPTESNKEKRVKRARIHEDHSEIFPFVEELVFSNLPNLVSWIGEDNCHGRFFPRLRKITIIECPMLKRMPGMPLSLENMVLDDVGLSELPPLQGQGDPVVFSSPSQPSSSSAQVPSLAHVELRRCPSLLSLNNGVLERRLPNLRKLTIESCENLQYPLVNGFKDFVSLESLELTDCPGLTTLSLKSDAALPADLRDLNISFCTNLETKSVQKSLQALTSLQGLTLDYCCRRMSKSFVKSVLSRHFKTIERCGIEFDGLCSSVHFEEDRGIPVDNENDAVEEEEDDDHDDDDEESWSSEEWLAIIVSAIPSSRVQNLALRGGEQFYNVTNIILYNEVSVEFLPADINKFSALVNLYLHELDFCPEDEGWVCVEPGEAFLGLKSVKHLDISFCQLLHSLPYSFFLETLGVKYCHGIRNISSLGSPMPHLRKLLISNCTNLENPPEKGFMMLQSLRHLILIDCPKLSKLSETKSYSHLPPSLSELTIMNCKELQFEHIEDYISELTSLQKLTIMNCGGRISKSFVNRAVHLLGPEGPFKCRLVSSEFAFQWLYVDWDDGEGSFRSIVSWGCISEEDRGDTCNCLEFLVEMLEVMSRYDIDDLTISGIHGLEVVEGRLKETVLSLTGLSELTIANCRNLCSFPTEDIASMLPDFEKLRIMSCSKLPLLDPEQVPYAIVQKSEYNDKEKDQWLKEERKECLGEENW